jgi:hypothetical protein
MYVSSRNSLVQALNIILGLVDFQALKHQVFIIQPHTSEQAQQHWRVNLIHFKTLINKQVPFSVFFSALISSASEDEGRSSGDVAKAELPATQRHIL